MPSLIIVAVLIMLRTSFCAVPAFIRVEPVITSGPTKVCIVRSAVLDIGLFSTQTTATVFAPLLFANSMAAWVYGVFPLAAIPITRSSLVSFFDFRSAAALARSSSLPSMACGSALAPPAMTACIHSGGVLNVGGISTASRMASRPLVPAPI